MPTFTDGNLLTAAQLLILVGNLNETAAAKATTAGSHFAGAGVNSLAQRVSAQDYIATSDTTTNTAFVNLTGTVGPTVTQTISAAMWVSIYGSLQNNVSGSAACMGYELSGANAVGPVDEYSISLRHVSSCRVAGVFLHTGLAAGSTTARARYRSEPSGTSTFYDRRLALLPL